MLLVAAVAAADAGDDLRFKRVHVTAKPAFAGDARPVTLKYEYRGSAGAPRPVTVRVVRVATRRAVIGWRRPGARPGRRYRRPWNGFRPNGNSAPDGVYAFQLLTPGQRPTAAGRFRLFNFRHPISGGHGTRGAIGEFGAPRAGGRHHQGFDVTAPCGTPLRAARAGRVKRAGFDPALHGNFIEVDARGSDIDYRYSHLKASADAQVGERVKTGERLGRVGLTGNASGTPCHLHIELRASGRVFDPKPTLDKWDRYS